MLFINNLMFITGVLHEIVTKETQGLLQLSKTTAFFQIQ